MAVIFAFKRFTPQRSRYVDSSIFPLQPFNDRVGSEETAFAGGNPLIDWLIAKKRGGR